MSKKNDQTAASEPNSEPNREVADQGTNPAEESQEAASDQLQADLERFRDLALRSKADFENYRKRSAREKEDAIKFSNAGFLERIIPILDNFELGLIAARSCQGTAPILSGMEMVFKQLQDFLVDSGVQTIDAVEGEFDPKWHEALAQEYSDAIEEGHIVRQMRKGYKLKDRLLRPANVIVSKGPAK